MGETETQHDQHLRDLRTVMRTDAGRRLIWELLARCNVHNSCFTGNSKTFYLEGRRDVGVELLNDIHTACLPEFQLMQREHITEA